MQAQRAPSALEQHFKVPESLELVAAIDRLGDAKPTLDIYDV